MLEILFLILFLITCGFATWGLVEDIQLKSSQKRIQDYVMEIDQLHSESIKATIEASKARLQADKDVKLANATSNKIIHEKVSHDCEKAIQWAANEAVKI